MEKYRNKLSYGGVQKEVFAKNGKTYVKNVHNMHHYAAMIESMDENVGKILMALEKTGIAENTVVIFTSDNGGMATSNRTDNIPTSNLPLRAGKGHLYEGGIRVPLIVRWPDKTDGAGRSDEPVTATDFYPTVLAMARMEKPSAINLDGTDLTPLLQGSKLEERPVFWHFPHYSGGLGGRPSGAVRFGDFKLIEFYEDMQVELYNLKADKEEKYDLSKSEVEKTRELKKLLHSWRKKTGALMPNPNPDYEEELKYTKPDRS